MRAPPSSARLTLALMTAWAAFSLGCSSESAYEPDEGPLEEPVLQKDALPPADQGVVDAEPDAQPDAEAQVDATIPCEESAVQPCTDGCGVQTCVDGVFGECEPQEERCNGIDDNCDGQIDEAFPELGEPCTIELGVCSSAGVYVCNTFGDGVECDAEPIEVEEEVCDGVDNNCDGQVDEGFGGQLCCTAIYHCPVGMRCEENRCTSGGGGTGGSGGGGGTGGSGGGSIFDDCFADWECDFGEACIAGRCVAEGSFCSTDRDCAPDEICSSRNCIDDPNPQPPVCSAPVEIDAPGTYRVDTTGRRDRHSSSCRTASGGEAVFSLQLPSGGAVEIDTVGSAFDTIMSIRTDCELQSSEIACNDDAPGLSMRSLLNFNATANTTYFILVDGWSGATGEVVLNVRYGDAPEPDAGVPELDAGVPDAAIPDAEVPDAAVPDAAIPDAEVPVEPDACNNRCLSDEVCVNSMCLIAPPLACSSATLAESVPFDDFLGIWGGAGDTGAGSDRFTPSCGWGGRDGASELLLAYAVEVPSRVVAVSSSGSIDSVLWVMSPCGREIACNDDKDPRIWGDSAVEFDAEPGQLYYIGVEDFFGDNGPVEIYIGHFAR